MTRFRDMTLAINSDFFSFLLGINAKVDSDRLKLFYKHVPISCTLNLRWVFVLFLTSSNRAANIEYFRAVPLSSNLVKTN